MQPVAKDPNALSPGFIAVALVCVVAFSYWKFAPMLSDDPATAQAALNERSSVQATPAANPYPESVEEIQNAPLEYQVAYMDAGEIVDRNGPEVRRVEKAFHVLEVKFTESRQQMSDVCVKSREILTERGETEKIVEVMEHVAASVPSTMPKGTVKIVEVAAAYTALRGRGSE